MTWFYGVIIDGGNIASVIACDESDAEEKYDELFRKFRAVLLRTEVCCVHANVRAVQRARVRVFVN